MNQGKKSVEVEIQIDATPAEVWEAVSTSEGLVRWFPLTAELEPGDGGSITLAWGPDASGTARVGHWEEGRRVGWIESYGEGVEVTVDFFLEGKDGGTVFRVVQSGFSDGDEWKDYLDTLHSGWRYFLFNLKHYLERHPGRPRTMVWRRTKVEIDRQQCWERLTGPQGIIQALGHPGVPVQTTEGIHWAAVVPELDDALIFLELEPGTPTFHLGVWISLYQTPVGRTQLLEQRLDTWLKERLGVK